MAFNLVETGEEFVVDLIKTSGKSFDVGLYNDSTDSLTDSSDLAAITSEPNTANTYARQSESAANLTVDTSGTDAVITFPTQTFDVSGNSQTVDAYFTVVNFTSDETGDSSNTDHLFFNGALSQSRDLSQINTLEVSNIGGSQD
jgi:accessory colonization factor AcfC